MLEELKIFWEEIQKIQDYAVNLSLSKASKYSSIEEQLNDITYETIYRIMELLDGYKNESLKGIIIEKSSGKSINSDIDLHNFCEDFLKFSDV